MKKAVIIFSVVCMFLGFYSCTPQSMEIKETIGCCGDDGDMPPPPPPPPPGGGG